MIVFTDDRLELKTVGSEFFVNAQLRRRGRNMHIRS